MEGNERVIVRIWPGHRGSDDTHEVLRLLFPVDHDPAFEKPVSTVLGVGLPEVKHLNVRGISAAMAVIRA